MKAVSQARAMYLNSDSADYALVPRNNLFVFGFLLLLLLVFNLVGLWLLEGILSAKVRKIY